MNIVFFSNTPKSKPGFKNRGISAGYILCDDFDDVNTYGESIFLIIVYRSISVVKLFGAFVRFI